MVQGRCSFRIILLFKGNDRVQYDPAIQDRMRQLTFCLAAAAANYPGQHSDSELNSGTQFARWEDKDACDRDLNVTGEDRYLYESNSLGNIVGTKAHADVYLLIQSNHF